MNIKEDNCLEEMIGLAGQVLDRRGIELVEGWNVCDDALKEVMRLDWCSQPFIGICGV